MNTSSYGVEYLPSAPLQPVWRERRTDLPKPPPDLYHDFYAFLSRVANWIRQRCIGSSKRNNIFSKVVRHANVIFFGIGVYTICELGYLAGALANALISYN